MKTSKAVVAFRTDASTTIGTGHVMRCLALAESLTELGFRCVFISAALPGNLNSFIRKSGFECIEINIIENWTPKRGGSSAESQEKDANCFLEKCKHLNIFLIIVDHYSFDKPWENMVFSYTKCILVIEDMPSIAHSCHIIVDSTVEENLLYQDLVPESTIKLLGPKFALLRKEFQGRQDVLKRQYKKDKYKLLINMGGTDPDNITFEILKALPINVEKKFSLTFIVGKGFQQFTSLKNSLEIKFPNASLKCGVKNMSKEMAHSDLAIGAAGTTAWERCAMGLPTIQLILAENQRLVAEKTTKNGAALTLRNLTELGDLLSNLNEEKLMKMAQSAVRLVDARGTERVREEIRKLYNANC